MSQNYSRADQAAGQIRLAMGRLADRYPFHASILEQFQVRHRPDVPTMAVGIAQGTLFLLFNADFVLQCSLSVLQGVLLHEVHHVLFGHVLADPRDWPDEWARTIAEEVSVNEFIREPLPAGVITLDQFPMLAPMQSTRERYQRLRKVRRRVPVRGPSPVSGKGDDDGGPSDPGGGTRSAHDTDQKEQGDGMRTLDDHSHWGEACDNPQQAQEAVTNAVQQAAIEVGTESVPDEWKAVVEAAGIGTQAGAGETALAGDQQGHLDWRRLLRRYVGQLMEPQPVLTRPPRRFPDLVGVFPAQSRRPEKAEIMAVIDTSGSITDELLELMDAELRRLSQRYSVHVVECDATIHAVYRYRRLDSVLGRGGTDLRPPFEAAFLRLHRPDLLIYFTDGEGPAPDRAPRVPVIWCLVPGGQPPASWGRVIWMGPPNAGNSGETQPS